MRQRDDDFKVERAIHQQIKSAGMGSANTLEIDNLGGKRRQHEENESVDNMSKSFNQSALAGRLLEFSPVRGQERLLSS